MSLQDIQVLEEYRTGQIDLIEGFYKPCLINTSCYDRAVGYFRSSVFVLIGPDLIDFAKKGGEIRLICSPVFTKEDVEAISNGYKSKNDQIEKAINQDIDTIFSDKEIAKNTEALATLISLGILKVKLAILPFSKGDYHEKLGIFTDENGDFITFKGSINETWNGWHERGNYESFDTFRSWISGRDERQANSHKSYFEKLWNNEIENIEIEEFPKVAIEKLKIASKKSLDDIDPNELVDFFNIRKNEPNTNETKGIYNKRRTPLPHQIEALEGWKKQNKRGILEHATGSGKTFTAITAIKQHLEDGGVVIVAVPDRLLHQQWFGELKSEIEGVIILKAGDGNNRWKKDDTLMEFTSQGKDLGKRIILVTMPTARTDDFINHINGGDHLMIVADEVHEMGSSENSKALSITTGPRLGLSATPRRYGDLDGTYKLINYFGGIVEPPYTLEDAISDGRLVPYIYYPKAIRLSTEESEQWEIESKKISKEYARSKRDKKGNAIISRRLQHMIIQRSRIAKKAQAKTNLAVEIIKEHYKKEESWLIYCEDQYQLNEVKRELERENFNPLEYHSNMSGDADAALEWFKNFGGILVSIKCLDQGVDIPKISHAIILASSQNPRQFIQRRGRVLRICDDKHNAVIFDAVVVPVSLELEPSQLSLLKSEFQRSIQFAKTALNKSAASELETIAIKLGIDPEEIGLIETDGIEEDEE